MLVRTHPLSTGTGTGSDSSTGSAAVPSQSVGQPCGLFDGVGEGFERGSLREVLAREALRSGADGGDLVWVRVCPVEAGEEVGEVLLDLGQGGGDVCGEDGG